MSRIIRVGVLNNYDFSEKERDAVKALTRTDDKVFVNANSFLPVTADFKSVVTVNPYLKFVTPKGDLSNVSAYRLKVVAGASESMLEEESKAIDWALEQETPLLLTFQRWRGKDSLYKYICEGNRYLYTYERGWYRAVASFREEYERVVRAKSVNEIGEDLIYVCDKAGEGCPSCRNCIKLTFPESNEESTYSLNLSASGDNGACRYNCPDCFAKLALQRVKAVAPRVNVVYQNNKQKGVHSTQSMKVLNNENKAK